MDNTKQLKLALFSKISQSGNKYLAGSIRATVGGKKGFINVAMFKNEKKTSDSQPVMSGYVSFSDDIAMMFTVEGEYQGELVIGEKVVEKKDDVDEDEYFS